MPEEVKEKPPLSLWENTIAEIRKEIKSWSLHDPHLTDYAKSLCDKLENSMVAYAKGEDPTYTIE